MTNTLPQEIELKLTLPLQRVGDFLARLARRRAQPTTQGLHTRYFDTPDFDLSAAGVALRVRRVGRRWVQTLKTEGVRQGGLSRRIEFEMPVTRGEPDWSRFPAEALAYVPAGLRNRVVPVFETRFERTAWLLNGRGGAKIEVALDRGEVRAGRASEPICEIELELKSGQPGALFDLALDWAAAFGCLPSDESKAARGVRLAHGIAPAPAKSPGIALDPDMLVEDGFVAICQDALAQFQANLPGVMVDLPGPQAQAGEGANVKPKPINDIEYVHQARVALRRLRAALRLYRGVCELPPELMASLRALAAALGPARDWDVLCDETLPAIAPHFDDAAGWQAGMAVLEARRAEMRAAMRAGIAAAHPGAWLLGCQRWLLARGWRAAPETQRFVQLSPLAAWTGRAMRRGHRAVLRDALRFESLAPTERHALRIKIKRQRYALEFFQSLYPGRAHARYLAQLRAVQDGLGCVNDARVAVALLKSASLDLGTMGAFVLGWLAAREADADMGENAKRLQNFVKSRVGW